MELANLLGFQPPQGDVNAGMADIVQPQQQQVEQGPGFLERLSGSLQQNPMLSQVLLHTFSSMARGNNMGSAVADGAKAAMLMQAQQREDEQEKGKIQREQVDKDRRYGLDEKRVGFEEQRLDTERERLGLERQRTEATVGQTKAQTRKTQVETQQAEGMFGLKKDQLRAQIGQIQEQIAASKDQSKTRQLQRQLDSVKLEYADAMYGAEATGKQLANNKTQVDIEQNQAELDTYNSLTPEEKKATKMPKGTGKVPKTPAEALQQHIKDNLEAYVVEDPKTGAMSIDVARAERDFLQIQNVGKPKPPEADTAALWRQARDSVKPGQPYRGPDGKMYKRGAQ